MLTYRLRLAGAFAAVDTVILGHVYPYSAAFVPNRYQISIYTEHWIETSVEEFERGTAEVKLIWSPPVDSLTR